MERKAYPKVRSWEGRGKKKEEMNEKNEERRMED